jgi:hypothetical protein
LYSARLICQFPNDTPIIAAINAAIKGTHLNWNLIGIRMRSCLANCFIPVFTI